jgi:hypothetical protein
MQEAGNHYSVYIVKDANNIKLTRYLRRFVIERLGHRPPFHLFWLHTSEGTMFCVAADKAVHRIMEDFFKEAVRLQHCSTATRLYTGSSKNELAKAIAIGILHYEPKGSNAKSFGGSVISATAAARANEAIVSEAMAAFNRGYKQ